MKIEEKEEDKEIVGKSKLEIAIFLIFVSFNLSYKLFMSAIMNANLHTLLPVILASPHESSQIPLDHQTIECVEVNPVSPVPLIPTLCASVDRKGPVKKALEYLTRTKVQGSDNDHQPCVCVICDSFIIGTETICYLSKSQLLAKTSYLHVSYLENMIGEKIPSTLHSQYKVQINEDLSELLLSPRAPVVNNYFMSCERCYNNIRNNKIEKPPRFAISNAWAIGYIPSDVIEEVEDILAVMVNKIRLFSYVFTYSGGAHKAIKGHHTFFMNDPEKIGSAMNHLKTEGQLNDVYVMACGRLTPTQRQIARNRCSINTTKYLKLLNWLIDNHPVYTDITRTEKCPQHAFMGFQPTPNNTDKDNGYSDSEEHKIKTVQY